MLRVPGRDAVRVTAKDLSRSRVALLGAPMPLGTQVEIELPDAGGSVPGQVTRADSGIIAVEFRDDPALRTRIDRTLAALRTQRAA